MKKYKDYYKRLNSERDQILEKLNLLKMERQQPLEGREGSPYGKREEEASETEASETSAKVKAKTATFADRFLKAWIALDKETQTKPELVALFDLAVDAGWQE